MENNDLEHARQVTAATIRQILQKRKTEELTRVNLDDITELAEEVSRVVPAGNVVAMVLSQLSSIKGNQVSGDETRQMMGLLKQGMSTFLDKATYLTFYTTPAILINGYQKILEAAGKDPASAFPNGTWQYYLEFGLREDTARHACETRGLQWAIKDEQLDVNDVDQLASWIMAASWLISIYDDLLFQEYRERIMLRDVADGLMDPQLSTKWVQRRPYQRPDTITYLQHRREEFDAFIFDALRSQMSEHEAEKTLDTMYEHEETILKDVRSAYRDQMTILTTLQPEDFSDVRLPFELTECQVAVAYRDKYFLVPVIHNGKPLDLQTIRALAQSILDTQHEHTRQGIDEILVEIPRQLQSQARQQLSPKLEENIQTLKLAPIIINWDGGDSSQTLSEIRKGRRGIGDHAMTLFKTKKSMVFDQSHIYFDAVWGMAVSEILTRRATDFLREIENNPGEARPSMHPTEIDLVPREDVANRILRMLDKSYEVSAEIHLDILQQFNEVRRLLQQRSRELKLTVNDLLILYRSQFNQDYFPSKYLVTKLEELENEGDRLQSRAAHEALQALQNIASEFPAFLIPIDATSNDPKERIFPITFKPQPPWTGIRPHHRETWNQLLEFEHMIDHDEDNQAWDIFNESRTHYLEMLRMFYVLMYRYKEVALAGGSLSTVTLQILSAVPQRLQSWLSGIPDRIDLLNDMLKGTEVFSNVGRVADDSSLTRFITAKDDNEKKVLCWGIMTRADDVMVVTLRDFRPWVTTLNARGATDVANLITQDYLQGFADGLSIYLEQLARIARATSD
jgi:hypothetical protein